MQQSIQMLRDESELVIRLTPQINNGEHPRQKSILYFIPFSNNSYFSTNLLGENDYYLYEDEHAVLCETRYCTVDIM